LQNSLRYCGYNSRISMINRTLVRTKVVQNVYAFIKDEDRTLLTAQKELLVSFDSTYNLYFILLSLVNELTTYAERHLDDLEEKAVAMHQTFTCNRHFVDNKFAAQLFQNRQLRRAMQEKNLNLNALFSAIKPLYDQIENSDFYKAYMAKKEVTYEDDKQLWKQIFTVIFPENEVLENALEDLELSLGQRNATWTTDLNVILSYTIKTIKQFKEDNGEDQPLQEMFSDEEELAFATSLLRTTITHKEEYTQLISSYLQNWDISRLADMDSVLLLTAVAELLNFPNIAKEITLNEYIELAKEYSSDNSAAFINGILDKIARKISN